MKNILNWKTLLLASLLAFGFCLSSLHAGPTRVLVVATIHGNHEINPSYSYNDLVNILSTFTPDAICVKIRPVDFRKNSYLKEMMLASIFGLEHGLKVYPIEWWGTSDDRTLRDAYIKTPEYKAKEMEEDSLVAQNQVMQEFDKKYGGLEKLWNTNTMGYEFFNGEEYNNYIKEMYGVSMAVYGDGPMNLSYKTRNDKMMEMIKKALDENPGRNIVKSVFDLNLGLCYDLLGERDTAINCYKKGEAVCRTLGYKDFYIKHLFRDLIDHPYQRKAAVPPTDK